ncbi:asparagine synthase (glutamine-hydrolyzing) [Nostoc sp. CHAB 5784]|uniref:asparagine synthase (glutamine-hydrolyzing) n=1 Tax=Nostoc mirabile TaxID=2907820 RepID=UPI001E4C3CCE|nr:asparagine synthase (glutamine-hydrolyzing) [Nostoc mirabile]MCC5670414.1 asparagine synthase (glutamine-hydrolyzing) [Nostoc mirabile CHAB5784]
MCGIVALFSKQEPISETSLQQAIARLYHRGPDGRKYWIAPHLRVGLGHTRLSIIDLETGIQPIANEDETLHIVVNGEFYDFERIQQDLIRSGHRLKTHSDSEIALHLYEEFGTQCLHYLRGEFAFVLWDERNELLFAARDRFGIKPLYYATIGDTLYLASEVKALFAAGVPAQWDAESFFQANNALLEHDRTLFQNIYQVPPGYFLLASRNHMQLIRYWDFNYPRIGEQLPQYTEGEYIEKLRYTLNEAIQLRLRADVPIGCYLSGGLDSSTLLGMAATHTAEPIHAFTISFVQEEYDEAAIARETAALTGAKLQIIQVQQSDLADHFADSVWHGETLLNNAASAAKYLMSKAVRDAGYKVVLTGEGADEIFGGYAHLRRDMLLYNAQGQDKEVLQHLLSELEHNNAIASGLLLPDGNNMSLASVRQVLNFTPTWIQTFANNGLKFRALYSSEFTSRFAARDACRVFLNQFDVQGQLAEREPVHQALYFWSKSIFPNRLLRMLGDGVEMAHSVEGRLPFLDHHLVELASKMPVSLKIRGMTEKYVLREAARPFLNNTVYQRQKHPFLAPPCTLKPNERLYQLLQDTLRSSVMTSLPFFDQAAVIALLDKLPEMDKSIRTAVDFVLMEILSACILQERFCLTMPHYP